MNPLAIGEVRITAVVEGGAALPCEMLYPGSSVAALAAVDWLGEPYVSPDGTVALCIQAFVVEAGGLRIVVDTCMGNDKPRTGGAGSMLKTDFLDRFEAAGFARDSIDVVLCTHLHIDHVGWNTMLEGGRWVPTFPRARYLVARTEFEHLRAQTAGDDPAIFADSVQPLIDHGLIDLVETDHVLCPEVRLVPTPGHTPGHVSVAIASAGAAAFISGDIAHSPVQFAFPGWAAFADHNRDRAEATRRARLAELADSAVVYIGTHFPAPTAGRVRRDGDAFRFAP